MTNTKDQDTALQRAVDRQAIARRARAIANSDRVLGVYAAPEFDELHSDGQDWIIAIVEETMARCRATELFTELSALVEILEGDCECPPCEGSDAPAEHHLGRAKRIIAEINTASTFAKIIRSQNGGDA